MGFHATLKLSDNFNLKSKKMKTKNPLGRGKGNLNKLTKEEKEALFNALKGEISQIGKYVHCTPIRERGKLLVKFFPFLVSKINRSEDEVACDIQVAVTEQLLPEYKRLGSYLRCAPSSEKAKILLAVLPYFTPQQRRVIQKVIEDNKELEQF